MEARRKKVRNKQVEAVDSSAVLAVFPLISTARCGRVDPLRLLDRRLVHSKTNPGRAKTNLNVPRRI